MVKTRHRCASQFNYNKKSRRLLKLDKDPPFLDPDVFFFQNLRPNRPTRPPRGPFPIQPDHPFPVKPSKPNGDKKPFKVRRLRHKNSQHKHLHHKHNREDKVSDALKIVKFDLNGGDKKGFGRSKRSVDFPKGRYVSYNKDGMHYVKYTFD